MSTNSPPLEVLDLNADAALMESKENPSVATIVPEVAIQPSSAVEVIFELENAESLSDPKTEGEVIMEESEVPVERVDVRKDEASLSPRNVPAAGNFLGGDVVVPDVNTTVDLEVMFLQQTEERSSDQVDGSFGEEITLKVLPENPSVGGSISDSVIEDDRCCDELLGAAGQKLEDRGLTASLHRDGDQNEEKLIDEEDKSILKLIDHDANAEVSKLEGEEKSILKSIDPEANAEVIRHVSYDLALEDKSSFSVSDLVWGKVKSHPWWPGQIIDPLNASDMARKHQKKEHLLVAYFGDKTFAWCDETKLKPFYGCFSQLANQSSSETFVAAVDNALAEVSRRVELSMSCYCVPGKVFNSIKRQKIDNAGINGVSFDAVRGKTSSRIDFQSEKFTDYLRGLAQYPGEVIDRLELEILKAQTISFNRVRGKIEDIVSRDHERLDVAEVKLDTVISEVKRRGGLRRIPERGHKNHYDNGKGTASGVNVSERSLSTSSIEHEDDGFAFDLPGRSKQKGSDVFTDVEVKTPAGGKSFKVGECISRVASRLKGSQTIIKCNGESLSKGGLGNRVFDVCSDDSERMKGDDLVKEFPSPEEMLSQLTVAARDPIERHSFLSTVVPFFTEIRELRDSVADEPLVNIKRRRGRKKKSETSDDVLDASPGKEEPVEKVPKKRGRKKKSESMFSNPSHLTDESGENVKKKRGRKKKSDLKENPKTDDQAISSADYMTDSYWTDRITCTSPEEKPSFGRQKRRGEQVGISSSTKKAKFLQEPLPLSKMMEKAHHLRINAASPEKRDSTVFFGDKRMEDSAPTALILSFNESSAIPSERNLIRIFSRYGPLKEAETEVIRETKSVKVVFKKRVDAEAAFSGAGKYRIFGPALISFRLKSPPSPVSSPQPCTNDQLTGINVIIFSLSLCSAPMNFPCFR